MTRLALAVSLGALSACGTPGGEAAQEFTNVILIVTNDQGFGDYGSAGNPVLDTPALDALAERSARFGRFYVNPVCSATRAALMTGRHPYRTGVVDTYRGRSMMDPEEVTLAEILRDEGYRTGIFGKWHLGDNHPRRPQDQGFEEVLVHRGGGLAQPSEPPRNRGRYTNPILLRNGAEVNTEGYCTDVYFDGALRFIDGAQAEGRPFFAYVATNAPHGPLSDVPEELLEKYRNKALAEVALGDRANLDRIARVYAMIENIDHNVGRLVAHLEERGLTENTLVVFLGDNGPTGGRFRAGLRGTKGTVYEGGIRSPLFLVQGERYRGADLRGSNVAHVDLLPTLLSALDLPQPGHRIDGTSRLGGRSGPGHVAPALVIQSHRGSEPRFEHNFAVIRGHDKLVRASGFGREAPPPDAPFQLFDLEQDPGETTDLAAERPGVVADLREVYDAWYADVVTARRDGFVPAPIVLDAEAEPSCVLTKQDWQPIDGGGWGTIGSWRLHAPRSEVRNVTLLFQEPRIVTKVRVELAPGYAFVREGFTGPQSRLDLGPHRLPAGPLQIRSHVYGEGQESPVSAHQVVLSVP